EPHRLIRQIENVVDFQMLTVVAFYFCESAEVDEINEQKPARLQRRPNHFQCLRYRNAMIYRAADEDKIISFPFWFPGFRQAQLSLEPTKLRLAQFFRGRVNHKTIGPQPIPDCLGRDPGAAA